MSKEKRVHTSVYIEEAFLDEIKMQMLKKKKWKSFNAYLLEALKEKLEKEGKK